MGTNRTGETGTKQDLVLIRAGARRRLSRRTFRTPPGSITYRPVRTPGAWLFIGDAHACQGDGEVCGVAMEYPTVTTIRVDLIKGWAIEWPRLEKEEFFMAIGGTRPLEDAARVAYRELD